jgi:hypothetical protein
MTIEFTPDRIAELREIISKASELPWKLAENKRSIWVERAAYAPIQENYEYSCTAVNTLPDALTTIEAQAREIERLTDELEKMKIRCLLKLDIDAPIQKLSIEPAREALKEGE